MIKLWKYSYYMFYVQLYYTYYNIQTYVLYIHTYIYILHYVHTKSIAIKLLVQLLHYVCHSPSQYLLLLWPKGVASWSFLNFLHFAPWNISSCSSYTKPTLLSWWDTKRLETFARTRNIQQPHLNMQWRTKPTEQNSVEGTSNVWRPAIPQKLELATLTMDASCPVEWHHQIPSNSRAHGSKIRENQGKSFCAMPSGRKRHFTICSIKRTWKKIKNISEFAVHERRLTPPSQPACEENQCHESAGPS